MNAVATIAPSRLPIPAAVAKEFEIQSAQWRVLVDQIFPAAKTVEAVTMALSYCRARKLDIFKKPVHIVPMYSTVLGKMVETVWPGIAEIRTTAFRTGEYAGIDAVEFGPMIERTFSGTTGRDNREKEISKTVRFPEWASVVVYRWVKGEKAAFHTKIYWEETYATVGKSEVPNDMWGKRPRGQLDKCVEAAALRKAFPEEIGSMYAAEEMEGRVIDHDVGDRAAPAAQAAPAQAPRPPAPPPAPPQRTAPAPQPPEPAADIVDAEIVDEETGEVTAADDFPGDRPAPPRTAGTYDDLDETAYFDKLEEELAMADDEATVEETWTQFDPMARFEGKDDKQAVAMSFKRKRLSAIAKRDAKAAK